MCISTRLDIDTCMPLASSLSVVVPQAVESCEHESSVPQCNVTSSCAPRGQPSTQRLTKAWLSVPSSLNRVPFETCLGPTGKWPPNPRDKACLSDAAYRRCDWLRLLPADRLWVVLDCHGYTYRPDRGQKGVQSTGGVQPLSWCAPPHVMVACSSCARSHVRPGLDTGLPFDLAYLVGCKQCAHPELSVSAVERRCRMPNTLAASFRGSLKGGDPYKFVLRSRLAELSNAEVRGLGRIQVVFTDRPDLSINTSAQDQLSHNFDEDFSRSHFGLSPRGDNIFSFRTFELMSHGVIPILISDGYLPPFEELIDWTGISLRVSEKKVNTIPSLLEKIPLDTICSMRIAALNTYQRYLRSPKEWHHAIERIIQMRARHSALGGGHTLATQRATNA